LMATKLTKSSTRSDWGDAGRAALSKKFPALLEDSLPPSDAEVKIIAALEASVTKKEWLAQLTDRLLITFTRGYVTNRFKDMPLDEGIKKTIPILHNALKFREKYDAKNVLNVAEDASMGDFKREWVSEVMGSDDNGRMVLLFTICTDDFMKCFPASKHEKFIVNEVRELEKMNKKKDELEKISGGKYLYKHILIVDMGSSGISMAKIKYLKKMCTWGDDENNFMQDFYPETLLNLWAVNTPVLFRGIWSVAKAFVDPITAAKFNLVSNVPLAAMQKAGIPITCIPKYLGGEFFYGEWIG